MASKKAGVITINLTAGTAQFVRDLDSAKAKVVDFGSKGGSAMREFGGHGVSQVQAVSGALRVFEGGMNGSLRAAERFLATTAGLGPALQAAFPVVGALAFAEILAKMGQEAYKFVESIRTAPEKMAGAWRALNDPLRATNDELRVAGDRLEMDIAKLEGKRQNTLQLALDEARLAADRLGDSLDADLTRLHKFITDNDAGIFKKLITGEPLGSDYGADPLAKQLGGFTGAGGFNAQKSDIIDRGNEAIAKATTLKQKDAAQTKLQTELLAAYDEQLKLVNAEVIKRFEARMGGPLPIPKEDYKITGTEGPEVERALAAQENLQAQRARAVQDFRVQADQAEKDAAAAANANAKRGRPFDDRMKQLGDELEASKAKLAAVGQGSAAETLTKGMTEAWTAIREVNKALEDTHGALTLDQMAAIHSSEQTKAQIDAETAWKTKLESTTVAIDERIASLGMLSAAIGKGYEATKRAAVETSVMGAVGLKNYLDPARQDDVAGVRAKANVLDDKERDDQVKKSLKSLQDQIDLEHALAKVQADGAEAVRQATLAQRLKQIADTNSAEAAKELMAAEIDKYNADRALSSAETATKLNEAAAATERLTAAVWGGADAIRAAVADNKYHQTARDSGSQVADAEKKRDEAKYQEQIATSAARMATSYGDALHTNELITQQLEKQLAAGGDALQIGIALRNLENERLKLTAQQTLEGGRAQDGVKAFFLDMQQSGQTAAKTIYDAMHSALDESSNELANLLTGRKTNWGKMFQDVGHQMLQQSIKSGFSQLLGMAAGKKGNPSILSGNGGLLGTGEVPKLGSGGGLLGVPDGTSTNPYYVVMADGSIAPATANQGWPQIAAPASQGPGIWSILGAAAMSTFGNIYTGALSNAGGGGGGYGTPDVHSTISYPQLEGRYAGGDVSPSSAYLVGEQGPEILFGASGRIASNSESRRILNNGAPGATYLIDARGTDPVQTEMRVKSSLAAVHGSAVVNSVQTVHDMDRRMPARR